MQINEYPIEAVVLNKLDYVDIDKRLSPGVYQSQKVTSNTMVLSIMSDYPELTDNLYIIDGVLTGERTIDANNYGMQFINLGDFLIQSTENIGLLADDSVNFGVNNAPAPMIPSMSIVLNGTLDSENLIAISNGALNDMFNLYGSGKVSIKNGLKVGEFTVQSDASILFENVSTTKGARPFPSMSTAQRNAISSPANGLGIRNTDTGYNGNYHPTYGWQSGSYGEIRLIIDFSATPLNSGNGWTMSIPMNIPINKIIHKIVGSGDVIEDPVGDGLEIGLDSDPGYFFADIGMLNSDPGVVSTGKSKRTLAGNENIKISYAGGSGIIDSGTLELLILHT